MSEYNEKLSKVIAAEFARGADSVIMENHGAVMCGENIEEAFARFEALDYVARIQINATSFGPENRLAGKLPKASWPEFIPNAVSAAECELRDTMMNFRARAYRQRLLFSGSAFMAARLGEDDFLVTPANFDPMYMGATDIVRMKSGMREAGKTPSSATPVIREIFNRCPWVNSVMMTRPPYLMAFAVTGTPIDSRTIPESYIMMRDVPLLRDKDYFAEADSVAKLLRPSVPVVMIENCGILTTGKSVLESFDRLEVSEFTAKCLILARKLGELRPINQDQVNEIVEDFKLPR